MVFALHGPDLQTLKVFHALDQFLGHEVADADIVDAEQSDASLRHDLVNFLQHRSAQHLDHVRLVTEQERHVEDLELGHEIGQRRVRRRRDVQGAGQNLFDHLDFAAELHVGENLNFHPAVGCLLHVFGDHLEPQVHGLAGVL